MKKCPYCLAEIDVEARKCKHCGEWVVERPADAPVPEPAELKVTVQPPSVGPTKACPYCAAQIPVSAWKCMYCKQNVLGGKPAAIAVTVVFGLIALVFFFGFWLPGCLEMRQKQQNFDQQWNNTRQLQEEIRKRQFGVGDR